MSSKARASMGAWLREYSVRKIRITSSFTQTGSVVLIRLVTSKSLRLKFIAPVPMLLFFMGFCTRLEPNQIYALERICGPPARGVRFSKHRRTPAHGEYHFGERRGEQP